MRMILRRCPTKDRKMRVKPVVVVEFVDIFDTCPRAMRARYREIGKGMQLVEFNQE